MKGVLQENTGTIKTTNLINYLIRNVPEDTGLMTGGAID